MLINGMKRKGIYSISTVLNNAKPHLEKHKYEESTMVYYHGHKMKMASDRYKCFIKSGTKCVQCGIEGQYFAKEKDIKGKKDIFHFNLYAVNKYGEEVLMTKDHIIPKSKGGKNHFSNYQTMCVHCNVSKGSNNKIKFTDRLYNLLFNNIAYAAY